MIQLFHHPFWSLMCLGGTTTSALKIYKSWTRINTWLPTKSFICGGGNAGGSMPCSWPTCVQLFKLGYNDNGIDVLRLSVLFAWGIPNWKRLKPAWSSKNLLERGKDSEILTIKALTWAVVYIAHHTPVGWLQVLPQSPRLILVGRLWANWYAAHRLILWKGMGMRHNLSPAEAQSTRCCLWVQQEMAFCSISFDGELPQCYIICILCNFTLCSMERNWIRFIAALI